MRELLVYFKVCISVGIMSLPLECVGAQGYRSQLTFWMVIPVVVATLAILVSFRRLAERANGEHESETITRTKVLQIALPAVLQVAFLFYPVVSSTAFQAFSCYEFDGGSSWLIADVAVECQSAEHAAAKTLAWSAVVSTRQPRVPGRASDRSCA